MSEPTFPIIYHVDDSPVDQLIIKKMIEREAPHLSMHQFPSVPKIMSALLARDRPMPHLLIVNLHLPQTMGWELIEAIEEFEVFPVKVVIVTSSIILADRQRARRYSVVSDFKTKPLSKGDVHDLLAYIP
ncbi:MAG: response regulator [Cyclobacteriaceae bacterium]